MTDEDTQRTKKKLEDWDSTKQALRQGDLRVWFAVVFIAGLGIVILFAIGYGIYLFVDYVIVGAFEWLGDGFHMLICETKAQNVAEVKECQS